MIQTPKSPYEALAQICGIDCCFSIKGKYDKETVQKHWNQLMDAYPYCIDYEWIEGTFDEINEVIEISLPSEQITCINDAMRIMIDECFFVAIDTRCAGKKKSALLLFSSVTIESQDYTVFAMYQNHSRTDFKAMVYLAEDFLNFFDEKYVHKSLPMGSYFPEFVAANCFPSAERSAVLQETVPTNILQFDFTSLKSMKEGEMQFKPLRNGYYSQTSEAMKLTQE